MGHVTFVPSKFGRTKEMVFLRVHGLSKVVLFYRSILKWHKYNVVELCACIWHCMHAYPYVCVCVCVCVCVRACMHVHVCFSSNFLAH